MSAWDKARDLERICIPLWMSYFRDLFGPVFKSVESKHDDLEWQMSKQGDFLVEVKYDDYTIEAKVQSKKYFDRQLPDFSYVLFEEKGNVELDRPGSSFWDSLADLYAFAYYNGKGLEYISVFRLTETQRWLSNRIAKFPNEYKIIHTKPESNDGLYSTAFRLVPLKHIPYSCILAPYWKPKGSTLSDLLR